VLPDFSAPPGHQVLLVCNVRLPRLQERLAPDQPVPGQRPRFAPAMRLQSAAAHHDIQVLVRASPSAKVVARKARVPALPVSPAPVEDHLARAVDLRLAFRNVPAGLVRVPRIKLLLAASVPAPLVLGFRRLSRENLYMRASRPPRADVHSWKSASPKANANFIQFVRVQVQVPADALFSQSRSLRFSASRVRLRSPKESRFASWRKSWTSALRNC